MPRRSKGARLWLQSPVRDETGRIIENAVWCIRDGPLKRRTGLGASATEEAKEAVLREYLIAKRKLPRDRDRDPAAVKIADVVAIYAEDVAPGHARPAETAARLERILDHFGEKRLSDLNQKACEEYVEKRGKRSAARRELEDLRAAVLHHWRQGMCIAQTPVVLPERGETRERWLTRSEAARLLWTAWRLTQRWKGRGSDRRTAQHVARFILVALYTGTRAGAICGAALKLTEGRGWVDLERGVFYRRAIGRRRTKKRQPSIRIPPRLLAHLRRWQRRRLALSSIIEWNGKPVTKINKAFRSVRRAAKLGKDVVPHTLRHTAITWQAQLGVPEHEILGFFGITREVFEQVYAHHHPDYQASAVNALTRAGHKRDERKQTRSNILNVA
jgi:integrase